LLLLFCVAGQGSQAQSVTAKSDRNELLIGERLQYDLFINLPSDGYKINFKLPDSIPHFDIIENPDFDTVNSSGNFSVHKKIIFTSFDSGAWHIPTMEVLLEKNTVVSKFNTDSLLVNVGYSPADSTNELRDIKTIMDVEVTDYTWLYIAAGALAAIIIIILLYWYFKKRKKKPVPVFHSSLSPYEEAMKALQELKEYDLGKAEYVKIYHVSLDEIFKKYYSRKQSRNLMNKTTGDILVSIKEKYDNPGLISAIAEVLRLADAVKFAKYIPAASESGQSLNQAREAIETIEKEQSPKKEA